MHFENISPNLREDNFSVISSTEMIQFANLEEDLDGTQTLYAYPEEFFPPPSPSVIFHAPRQALPLSRMGFAAASTLKDSSSPFSSSVSSGRASMVGDVQLGDIHFSSKRFSSTQVPTNAHFKTNPIGETDSLEPLPVSQYSYFQNTSWSEDPAFCNEVFY